MVLFHPLLARQIDRQWLLSGNDQRPKQYKSVHCLRRLQLCRIVASAHGVACWVVASVSYLQPFYLRLISNSL